MPNIFRLCSESPSRRVFLLSSGDLVIGRSSECDLVLKHETVSRRHAHIAVCGSQVVITDLDSRNGTFVDGNRIQQSPLAAGQLVTFGGVQFQLDGSDWDGEDVDSDLPTGTCTESPDPRLPLPLDSLSTAQRRIFDALVEGLAEKQIARRLHISQHTVHNHVRAIYTAFAVHSRSELLIRVFQGMAGGSEMGKW
jgi:pSer/pThr/pTyr-binding forkhead associated (FHA) protein